jgi:hypothetical protein
MAQTHSIGLVFGYWPAKSSTFQPFEARNTLPPVVVFFIDRELGASYSPCVEPFSLGARLSRSASPRDLVNLRA